MKWWNRTIVWIRKQCTHTRTHTTFYIRMNSHNGQSHGRKEVFFCVWGNLSQSPSSLNFVLFFGYTQDAVYLHFEFRYNNWGEILYSHRLIVFLVWRWTQTNFCQLNRSSYDWDKFDSTQFCLICCLFLAKILSVFWINNYHAFKNPLKISWIRIPDH